MVSHGNETNQKPQNRKSNEEPNDQRKKRNEKPNCKREKG